MWPLDVAKGEARSVSGGPWQGRLNPKMGPAGPGQGTQDLSQGQASQEVCRYTA